MPSLDRSQPVPLEALLDRTMAALSILDAEALEDLLGLVGSLAESRAIALPLTSVGWARAGSLLWMLKHLLGSTSQRLTVLRRIAMPGSEFGVVRGEPYCHSELKRWHCPDLR